MHIGHCINSCKGNTPTTLGLNFFRCTGDESNILSCPGGILSTGACTEAAGLICGK